MVVYNDNIRMIYYLSIHIKNIESSSVTIIERILLF